LPAIGVQLVSIGAIVIVRAARPVLGARDRPAAGFLLDQIA
jgi:hypothetical protein